MCKVFNIAHDWLMLSIIIVIVLILLVHAIMILL